MGTSVKAVNKYIKKSYDRINFVMPKGRKEQIKRCADLCGISASEWINRAIMEKIERQGIDFTIPEKESQGEI